ncbi:unnamed protein product, partial [Mesorhabditis spiculigera]
MKRSRSWIPSLLRQTRMASRMGGVFSIAAYLLVCVLVHLPYVRAAIKDGTLWLDCNYDLLVAPKGCTEDNPKEKKYDDHNNDDHNNDDHNDYNDDDHNDYNDNDHNDYANHHYTNNDHA